MHVHHQTDKDIATRKQSSAQPPHPSNQPSHQTSSAITVHHNKITEENRSAAHHGDPISQISGPRTHARKGPTEKWPWTWTFYSTQTLVSQFRAQTDWPGIMNDPPRYETSEPLMQEHSQQAWTRHGTAAKRSSVRVFGCLSLNLLWDRLGFLALVDRTAVIAPDVCSAANFVFTHGEEKAIEIAVG